MRFKRHRYDMWHRVFCWLPESVEGEWVWLERVWRRRVRSFPPGRWEYRLTKPAEAKLQEDK